MGQFHIVDNAQAVDCLVSRKDVWMIYSIGIIIVREITAIFGLLTVDFISEICKNHMDKE